jgi:hypothetical protein
VHDKKQLTLDDIVFTLNIIQDPEYLSPLRASFLGVSLENYLILKEDSNYLKHTRFFRKFS